MAGERFTHMAMRSNKVILFSFSFTKKIACPVLRNRPGVFREPDVFGGDISQKPGLDDA